MLELAAIFGIIFLGATVQRVSGMGLGLLAGPVLSIILGPIEGILVVNVMAVINAALNTAARRADIDWRTFSLISTVLVLGAIPAAILLNAVPVAAVLVLVGALILVALGVVTWGAQWIPPISGNIPLVIAGIAAGFMNTLAGVAGPALTVYAQMSKWEQRSFSATLQPIFFAAGLISIVVKVLGGAANLNHTEFLVWPVGIVAMALGIVAGGFSSPRVSGVVARRAAVSLAALGALVVLIRGLVALLG